MVEVDTAGCIVTTNGNDTKRLTVEGVAVGVAISGFVDVGDGEYGNECVDVRFHMMYKLKGSGDDATAFEWKVVADFNSTFDGIKPERRRKEGRV